jgi:hypothetical protein
MAKIRKAQRGYTTKPTADSTAYFKKMQDFHYKQAATNAKYGLRDAADEQMRSATQAVKDQFRQSNKGKPGYDKDGFPIKKQKMGGKIKKAQAGLKASNKRVGPVDPQGAWTKVQEQTIAGKRTPVSLTRDKQLGATKMAKKGVKVKAKDGKWIQKAINPKHKGYCTPMTKKTCTPKRKALAVTLKKMAKSRKGK